MFNLKGRLYEYGPNFQTTSMFSMLRAEGFPPATTMKIFLEGSGDIGVLMIRLSIWACFSFPLYRRVRVQPSERAQLLRSGVIARFCRRLLRGHEGGEFLRCVIGKARCGTPRKRAAIDGSRRHCAALFIYEPHAACTRYCRPCGASTGSPTQRFLKSSGESVFASERRSTALRNRKRGGTRAKWLHCPSIAIHRVDTKKINIARPMIVKIISLKRSGFISSSRRMLQAPNPSSPGTAPGAIR